MAEGNCALRLPKEHFMGYRCTTDLFKIQDYLQGATLVAFDFETAPLPQYRADPKASLDPHRAFIVGISLSVEVGSAIYIPLRHSRWW